MFVVVVVVVLVVVVVVVVVQFATRPLALAVSVESPAHLPRTTAETVTL